ncbi:MAG: AAA family ATPase, partial [Aggregatilineales bacterium]
KIRRIFEYCKARANRKHKEMDGQAAIDALVNLCVPTKTLNQDLSHNFARERKEIKELTTRQYRFLSKLREQKRAMIIGGAGTGKTMLAMEKATLLATSGFRTLFLTYNRNINDWISRQLSEDIDVMTVHKFAGWAFDQAGIKPQRNIDDDKLGDKIDEALQYIRHEKPDQLYDALIIDEAQDFAPTWWLTIPDILISPEEGILYVFSDDNQKIYRTHREAMPIKTEPYLLNENCRNTQNIHELLLNYITSDHEVFCDAPVGSPIEIKPANSDKQIRDATRKILHQLLNKSGIKTSDIVILTPVKKNSLWQTGLKLGNFQITRDLTNRSDQYIRVSTIQSYKGLESPIIIITELDKTHNLEKAQLKRLIYVGLSRASNKVYIIGDLPV